MTKHHASFLAATLFIAPHANSQACEFSEPVKVFSVAPDDGHRFGFDAAISGDIAAISDRSGLGGNEPVFIYRRVGTNWVYDDVITNNNPTTNSFFGGHLDLSGTRVAISADGEDDDILGEEVGAVYTFVFDGTSWVQEQRITPSDGAPNDQFGGYLNLDGNTLIVGAFSGTTNGQDTGALYVFEHDGSQWVETAKIEPAAIGAGDSMTGPAARIGNTILAGNFYGVNQSGTDTGVVYEYKKISGAWTYQSTLMPAASNAGAFFGSSIDIEGATAVIGAFGDEDNGWFAGAAHIFHNDGSQWTETQKIKPSDPEILDAFGKDSVIDGDTIVVCSGGLTNQHFGDAYLFRNDKGTWVEDDKISSPINALTGFADKISVSNGTILLPADNDFELGNGAGAAYFYDIQCSESCPVDVNGDGMVTPTDFTAWINNFNAGC